MQVLGLRLCNQHAVEWVSMVGWKRTRTLGVIQRNRKRQETLTPDGLGKAVAERAGVQLPKSSLDRDFPGRGSTDVHL